jgi:hypothetical protein
MPPYFLKAFAFAPVCKLDRQTQPLCKERKKVISHPLFSTTKKKKKNVVPPSFSFFSPNAQWMRITFLTLGFKGIQSGGSGSLPQVGFRPPPSCGRW